MLKHFAADGTVKQVFPSAVSVQLVYRRARLWGQMQVIAEVVLADGELVAEEFSPVLTVYDNTPQPYMSETSDIAKGNK